MKKKLICLTILWIFLDILTKSLVDKFFIAGESFKIINNFFNITKVYNTGASWNILANSRFVLIIISIVFLIFLIIYQKNFKDNLRNTFAFSLVYGGIIGNLINRLFNGYVIDFLDFIIFGYDYPVFNLADICIILGMLLLVIAIFKKEDIDGNNS